MFITAGHDRWKPFSRKIKLHQLVYRRGHSKDCESRKKIRETASVNLTSPMEYEMQGVAIETRGFTFVTSGKRRETLTGEATVSA